MEKRIKIDDVGFSLRCGNALKNMGIKYLDEVCKFHVEDLLKQRNVGRETIKEIRDILSSYELHLVDDALCSTEKEKRVIINLPSTIMEIRKELDMFSSEIRRLCIMLDQIQEFVNSRIEDGKLE
jgi:Bacterial RNA polymerase, alpha chain C terminal domain